MKKVLLVLPLLLSGAITCAMDKMGASISRRDPFMQLPLPNAPKLSEEQIVQLIKDGKYDELAHELNKDLKADHKFTSGQFKDKSLLEVAFEHSITNRNDIAAMLLKRGAHIEDLNPFVTKAIKKFDSDAVKWLLDHGAKPASDALIVVTSLEKAAQGLKKDNLTKIKKLLEERQVPLPAKPAAAEQSPRVEQPKARIQLPVVKKFDKKDQFTVLGEREEAKLFKVMLSGDDKKLTEEYLAEGLSPDFKFTLGSPGKSLLEIAVTQTQSSNQEKIADILLAYGANSADLNGGLTLAIERFEKPKVKWLLEKGAQPTDEMVKRAEALEKTTAQPIKQKVAAEIKVLLKKYLPTQYSKPLPPVPSKKSTV